MKGGDEEDSKTPDSPTKKLKDEFGEVLSTLLLKKRAWTIVVVLLALSGFLVSSAAQLETPTEVERWFPQNHMMESIQQELREDFLGSSLDAYVDLTFLWGIDGIDRSGFDMFGTNSYRGSPMYSSSFDLFQESSQRSVLEACNEMMSWTCDARGCNSPFGTLALPGTQRCFLKDFRSWHFSRYGVTETYSPLLQRD